MDKAKASRLSSWLKKLAGIWYVSVGKTGTDCALHFNDDKLLFCTLLFNKGAFFWSWHSGVLLVTCAPNSSGRIVPFQKLNLIWTNVFPNIRIDVLLHRCITNPEFDFIVSINKSLSWIKQTVKFLSSTYLINPSLHMAIPGNGWKWIFI